MAQDYLQAKDYSVGEIFKDFRPFHIPTFQRPYSWSKAECEKLWEDLVTFFKEKEPYKVNNSEIPRYFLGALVVYQDGTGNQKQMEVIDGQQRITTLMLLLKAFYDLIDPVTDRRDPAQQKGKEALESIEKALWVQEWDDEKDDNIPVFQKPILSSAAIDDKASSGDFVKIMTEVNPDRNVLQKKTKTSKYVTNYLELIGFIEKAFQANGELAKVPKWRIVSAVLNNLTMLFIKTNAEDDALRIFNTLNNRGMQLLDADILKSKLYLAVKDENNSYSLEKFRSDWMLFSALARKAKPIQGTQTQAQDEMFRMLMMWVKASKGNEANDIQLRTYFEKKEEGGSIITSSLLGDIMIPLTAFFATMSDSVVISPDDDDDAEESSEVIKCMEDMEPMLSEESRKWLQVMTCFSKNTYWRHMAAVFFVKHREDEDFADKFAAFIKKAVAFNILYLIYEVPFTNIRKKVYHLLTEIYVNGDFNPSGLLEWSAADVIDFNLESFGAHVEGLRVKQSFSRSLTLLHAYLNPNQEGPIPLSAQVEHVFPRSWEKSLSAKDRATGIYGVTDEDMQAKYIEKLGNKVMCEAALNNGAKDSYFDRKAGIYQGAFSAKYKGAVNVAPDGTRAGASQESPKNAAKAKATEIADLRDIYKSAQWGKVEIDKRDAEVKKRLFEFFKEALSL